MFDKLINKIFEWVAVLLITSLIFWLALTQPILPTTQEVRFQLGDVQQMQKQVIKLSSITRTPEFDNLRPPARYIHKQFKQYGEARYQPYESSIGQVNNVILSFGPDTKDVIVIGAHYDSYEGLAGANDNASGVAVLLELARLLSVQHNLPMRIELVAYALSEGRYHETEDMGSFYHAKNMKKEGKHVSMMMSLDGVGYFTSEENSQKHRFSFMKYFYPTRGNYIRISGRLKDIREVRTVKKGFSKVDDLKTYSVNIPEVISYIHSSDNFNYWIHGYPAVLISDTGKQRYNAHHTAHDVAENLDYQQMALIVQALGEVIVDLSIKYLETEEKKKKAKSNA
ncbi:MAG: M28 family peptidase [Thiotrichaceae bacterium]|nr:M28 family peptidase [Thiotrichaceae bacterium]